MVKKIGAYKFPKLNTKAQNLALSSGKYYGEVMNQMPEGWGVLISSSLYEGEFKKGVLNGKGRLIKEEGDYFEGSFENGLLNGQGIYVCKDFIYTGLFLSGKFDDQGKILTSDKAK